MEAINQVIGNKDEIIENLNDLIELTECTTELKSELKTLECRLLTIQKQVEDLVSNNAKVLQDQNEYREQYDVLIAEYQQTQGRYEEKRQQVFDRMKKVRDLKNFIEILSHEEKLVTKFDKTQFNTLIEKIVISKGKTVKVTFKNDMDIDF
ncbi:hypothetical protein [Streptococcus acidominimus]|uniref:Site-specific recombinase n=1 Tax=Streptococcus acidominimus TaxID=1326 RepID=A0A4Y9FK09_STRAI|nr:hypothetical protein [Streptococcus acidominimus]MBF0819832.1 hypothetical protein [Streptococcus acidominimus]MBF0838314.1 hypothetical protein [Streptococcus acidominimus]MBF0846107.1 hypothetical protein [Streptococcus danieliae]TFU29386.1 hypothetical protein E4U01_10290 [Streptococcus acidominimus]